MQPLNTLLLTYISLASFLWDISKQHKTKRYFCKQTVVNLISRRRGKVTKTQLNITKKSQEISPFPVGDHKAAMNRRESMTSTRHKYEGCSNMNASRFITFVTYMLRQNGIRFYKAVYVIFKLAPDLKQNTVYLLSYRPLNKGLLSILTNSMLI